MILLRNIKLPKIAGIALWPFVLVRAKNPSKTVINHERIHLRQQTEMLVIFFYFWYAVEWLFHYVRLGNWWAAYYQISFEKECYAMEHDFEYLKNRKFWAFLKWM